MYDLANVWLNGVGWIQFHPDAAKRKVFMNDYFKIVLDGYTSETQIKDSMLKHLPLFIQINIMENIIDAFEVMRNNGEEPACDEEFSYLIKCLEEDIPYKGFFHEVDDSVIFKFSMLKQANELAGLSLVPIPSSR